MFFFFDWLSKILFGFSYTYIDLAKLNTALFSWIIFIFGVIPSIIPIIAFQRDISLFCIFRLRSKAFFSDISQLSIILGKLLQSYPLTGHRKDNKYFLSHSYLLNISSQLLYNLCTKRVSSFINWKFSFVIVDFSLIHYDLPVDEFLRLILFPY